MRSLATMPIWASLLILSVSASPMPQEASETQESSSEPTVLSRRRTHNCDQKKELKDIEAQAWADAGAMAELATEYDNGNQWQPAMDMWMGSDSTDSDNFWKIQDVLDNQKAIHSPNWVFPEAVVEIYCGDTQPTIKRCTLRTNPKDPNGPKVMPFGNSWVERGNFYNTYNMILCPRFFKEKKSLETLLKDIKDGKEDGKNPDTYKKAWGHTVYHELTHMDPVVAAKEVWDPAYYACPARKLANQNACAYDPVGWSPPKWDDDKRGPAHTLINADSWAFFASGVYFQKALDLKEPADAINDCGIYTHDSVSNYTWFDPDEMAADGFLEATVDREGDSYDAEEPPQAKPENTPPGAPSTPSLPYEAGDLPEGHAMPFEDAESYFESYDAEDPSTTEDAEPTEATTEAEEPETEEPDMESEACKSCSTNLGASDCSADDNQCLVDQCKEDDICTECGLDCDQYVDI